MVEPERLATKNTLRLTVAQTALTHALKTVNKFAGKGRFKLANTQPPPAHTRQGPLAGTLLHDTILNIYPSVCNPCVQQTCLAWVIPGSLA